MDSDNSGHQTEVTVEAAAWRSAVTDPEAICREAVEATLRSAGAAAAGPVTVRLADDAMLRELNRTWRGKDAPTNVLSFPAGDPPEGLPGSLEWPLGDLALAFETSSREAREEGKPLAHHLAHLVVHGTLHLLGHDHERPAEAEAMEALERRILAELGVPDPYRAEAPG